MTKDFLFWLFFILWIVLAFAYPGVWIQVIEAILIALLGWKTYGPAVKG